MDSGQLFVSDIKNQLSILKPILQNKYKLKSIGLFGSIVNGNFHKDSDIDILVEFEETPGWEFFQMLRFLESQFNRKIDLVTREAIKPQMKKNIEESVVMI